MAASAGASAAVRRSAGGRDGPGEDGRLPCADSAERSFLPESTWPGRDAHSCHARPHGSVGERGASIFIHIQQYLCNDL